MRIKKMTATFGVLNKASLELDAGLNLICAPNESGKSTWAAFWRAMLYGLDTRERDRKGYLPERKRYLPWSGAPMEGEVELEWEGRDVTIRRGPRGNVAFGAFSAVYTGTEEAVPGLTAATCGELLTGVSREVFERSAFIGSGGNLTVTAAPDLEKRIAALISSGEEDVSFSQTQERLREWRNRRKVNRSTGLIPRLEGELAQTMAALDTLASITQEVTQLEGERVGLARECARLEGSLESLRQQARSQLNRRCAQAGKDLAEAQAQLDALHKESARFGVLPSKEELKRYQGELQYLRVLDEEIRRGESDVEQADANDAQAQEALQADRRFAGLTGEEARGQAEACRLSYQEHLEKAVAFGRRFWLFQGLGVLLGGGLAGLSLTGTLTLPIWAGAGVYLAFAVLSAVAFRGRNERRRQAAALLENWQVSSLEELHQKAEEYVSLWRAAEEANRYAKTVRLAVNEHRVQRENSRAGLLTFVHGFAPEIRDLFGCSAALSRALGLEHDLALAEERVAERRRRREDLLAQGGSDEAIPIPGALPEKTPEALEADLAAARARLEQTDQALNRARGRQSAAGDPAALSARQEELETQLARRRQEYDALTLALEGLEQANARLQERFSPALNQLTGRYLARLTGQRYASVSLDRNLEGSASRPEDVLGHSSLYLSRGTADQLYLAVRLAICQLCLEKENPPLLLDDALAAFDDERMGYALELLQELAAQRQVILFTCQSREGDKLGLRPKPRQGSALDPPGGQAPWTPGPDRRGK